MESKEIRQKFLDFFEHRGHTVVPSSSLIPDDPSVLLTTAGMQQFKPYYAELDPTMTVHPLIGKPVGKSATSCQKSFRTSDIDEVGDERHLTFFEMLGNFSFGGYFKKEAITLAHEFVTKEMGLTIEWVSIFEGKDDIGVPRDTESEEIWRSLGVTDIRPQGMDDVFWGPTGSSGPCGPTTEIYCKNGAGEDIEIWNVVFNQFFYPGSREELNSGVPGKKLEPLKTPGVDTGMGLERLVMVKQKTKTVFETDLFKFVIDILGSMSDWSKRIIADHVRAIVFLIADGVRPSNRDQGYILRRLMRRVVPHLKELQFLELVEDGKEYPIWKNLERIADSVIDEYGSHESYSYLLDKKVDILRVIEEESEKFAKVYEVGKKLLDKAILAARANNSRKIEGEEIFNLVTTHGFSLEWIKDMAKMSAIDLDLKAFEDAFKRHQELSRAGQEAKFGGHGLYMKTGEVTIRDISEVEKVTRLHTATHLMHAALRAVLGDEVRQNGSDITVERTRFDFNFSRRVAPEELQKVEGWVNDAVAKDLKVEWKEMSYDEAVKDGALGFFKTKYPPRVKVYTMYDEKTGKVYSKELCGGPHVEHTAMVGKFKITKEESSSAGVRRIRGIVE